MSKRLTIAVTALVISLAGVLGAQTVLDEVGPLEQRAKAVTPENPIPRRTYSIAPQYPAEARAVQATATVALRVTLDEAGRVSEIRRINNPLVLVPSTTPSSPAVLQSIGDALVRSAAAALQQWLYDPPADGPVSFTVTFRFRPDGEVASSQSSADPTGAAAVQRSAVDAQRNLRAGDNWPPAAGAIRVGGNVRPPARVAHISPVYPADAQQLRVQGVVILEAVIAPDGSIADARVLRSIPLLDQAALDAVRQWRYEPTLLNGVPVPLVMTVTVQFTLT